MKSYLLFTTGLVLAASLAVAPAPAQQAQATRETVEGVTNFVKLETTVACAGAVKATAVPEIKKMGFASIVNLRQAGEAGADLDAEAAAAKEAGIRYYWIPFNG